MSLLRTVYLGAILCGWLALAGWFSSEVLWGRWGQSPSVAARSMGLEGLARWLSGDNGQVILSFWIVGGAVGAGLGLSGGFSNPRIGAQVFRMVRGFLGGGIGGAVGGWIGSLIYQTLQSTPVDGSTAVVAWWLRPVGWMVAGSLVGLGEGLFAFSGSRIRNGLIGGLVGGLAGGALFDPILALVARTAASRNPLAPFDMTSRASGFVVVGLSIGAAVGLTHLLLRHAWLTVIDGDRPGRQIILGGGGLTIGNDPSAGLPFTGGPDRSLLPEHLRITRSRDGSFSLTAPTPGVDVSVNFRRPGGQETVSLKTREKGIVLEDDSVIVCGRNWIRFNERSHRGDLASPSSPPTPAPEPGEPSPAPPSPPPPGPRRPARPEPVVRAEPPALTPLPPPPPARPRPAPRTWAPPEPRPARPEPSTLRTPTGPTRNDPSPAPVPAPEPTRPAPSASPSPSSVGANVCPAGHKVPPGQRFCIICDSDF